MEVWQVVSAIVGVFAQSRFPRSQRPALVITAVSLASADRFALPVHDNEQFVKLVKLLGQRDRAALKCFVKRFGRWIDFLEG